MDKEKRRSRFEITLIVETEGLSPAEHDKRARWAYRNVQNTNADMQDAFILATVRDAEGRLMEFTGSGRGTPSEDIQKLIQDLASEER